MTERVLLQKRQDGTFAPASEHDAEQMAGIPVGGYVRANPKQPRNPQHHKLAFVLLHAMYDNQDGFDSFDRFYDWVKLKCELVDLVEMTDKGPVYKMRSLSFAAMDQLEFRGVYESFLALAADMGIDVREFA